MSKDYYEILGVSKNANKEDIKKAYYKLAHKYHPDKSKSDDKKFKEINEAYQILSNDKKRAEYDAYGRIFEGAGGPGGFGFGDFDFSANMGDFDLNDIFENFFGSSAGRVRKKRGRDISIDLEISFEESIFGTERRVVLSKISLCLRCKGGGAEPGSESKTCDMCHGSGRVHESRKSFFGSFTALKECEKCLGRGTVPSKKCRECKGSGILPNKEEITIKIPQGIYDGGMIKLSGMGEAVSGGVPGDLYAKIHVRPHPIFKREANNLFMDLDIKLSDAILGEEKSINTLDGKIKLKIPAGIDSGEILRVKGKGIPHGRERGDLMIRVKVRTPKKISSRTKKIIEDLKKEGL